MLADKIIWQGCQFPPRLFITHMKNKCERNWIKCYTEEIIGAKMSRKNILWLNNVFYMWYFMWMDLTYWITLRQKPDSEYLYFFGETNFCYITRLMIINVTQWTMVLDKTLMATDKFILTLAIHYKITELSNDIYFFTFLILKQKKTNK